MVLLGKKPNVILGSFDETKKVFLLLLYLFYFLFCFLFILGCAILLLVFLLREENINKDFLSFVESGFSRYSFFLGGFSLRFFLIMLLFILFDLEILFLVGLLFFKRGGFSFFLFLGFLFFSLWLE